MKICHVTCVHSNYDTRIFYKECTSLAKAGYDVYLVAKGDSREENGVHVVGVGKEPNNRVARILSFAKKVYRKALELNCDIYHFHDPELLPYALKIHKKGKKVIFDSHEDVTIQIYDKEWIPRPIRCVISNLYHSYENKIVRKIDAVIAATPYIGGLFLERAPKVAIVNNYPKMDEIEFHTTPFKDREPVVCFAGSIDDLYGHQIMIKAIEGEKAFLHIAGDHAKEIHDNVVYLGRLNRKGVNDLYGQAIAGFCLYLPQEDFLKSQPTKMYEYMAAGLPVICSDFPYWKQIIDKTQAGICVDINNISSIKKAIRLLVCNREYAQTMSNNGRKAIEEEYNWDNEEKVLLNLYEEL